MRRLSLRSLAPILLLAVVALPAGADPLTADVDRTRIGPGDTLTLHLSAEGNTTGEPDLAPLSADFEVLGQSSGSRMSIVNGSVSSSRDWSIELAPRRAGRLQIPSLSLAGHRTQPIAIEVADSAAAAGSGPSPLMVKTEAEAKSPYVQQGFSYRVRLYFLDQPRRASLSDPVADGALIEQDGEDRRSAEMLNGRRYTVVERRYRVVPQRSGPLTIKGPRLEAILPETRPGAGRSPFADFESAFGGSVFQGFPNLADLGSGRRVVERGPDLTVQVRPQPAGSGADWLPAESVQLTDEWTPAPPRFRVGEPLTRTLTITAQGTTAAQLPTLEPGRPEGAQIYPEAPKAEDLTGSPSPGAIKTLKVAVVPTRPGSLTLPEIRLAWWDTKTDQARVAAIPQRTVQVEPAPGGGAAAPQAKPSVAAGPPEVPAAVERGPVSGSDGDTRQVPAKPREELGGLDSAGPWPWVALTLAVGWMATLISLWVLRGRRRTEPGVPESARERRGESLGSTRARVRQACLGGDARAARSALLAWGRARWRGQAPRGLDELGARLADPDIREPLARIDRIVYGASADPWDGVAAWRLLEPRLVTAERDSAGESGGPLPELYPRGG